MFAIYAAIKPDLRVHDVCFTCALSVLDECFVYASCKLLRLNGVLRENYAMFSAKRRGMLCCDAFVAFCVDVTGSWALLHILSILYDRRQLGQLIDPFLSCHGEDLRCVR